MSIRVSRIPEFSNEKSRPKYAAVRVRHIAHTEKPYPSDINHIYFLNPILLTRRAAPNNKRNIIKTSPFVINIRLYFYLVYTII